jgi:hypothetical protein
MAKRRRSRTNTGKKTTSKRAKKPRIQLPIAAEVVGFTELDEAFFAAGTDLERAPIQAAESFDDLDAAMPQRPSFWRRLFSRARNRATLAV